MIKYLIVLSLIISPFRVFAQGKSVEMRIYLVGDAGKMEDGHHPVVEDLRSRLMADQIPKTHLIYLGDNIYPFGLPDEADKTRQEAETILNTQLDLWTSMSGKIWMVPGNHDWDKGKSKGWETVLRAQNYVDTNFPTDKVMWLPKNACPGPVDISLDENTLLILLDSQWWLHKHEKPELESACAYKTKEEILEALTLLLEENQDKVVLFAMHHPMRSYGPHNGGYNWKDHIFPFTALSPKLYIPLPILGSIYPLYRTWFGDIQDIPNPHYQAMIHALDDVFKLHPHVIHVAGHEHGLFYTKEEGRHYIVSGAGAKNTHIRKKNSAEFTYSEQGYAFLDFYEDQTLVLNFIAPGSGDLLFKAVLIQ